MVANEKVWARIGLIVLTAVFIFSAWGSVVDYVHKHVGSDLASMLTILPAAVLAVLAAWKIVMWAVD